MSTPRALLSPVAAGLGCLIWLSLRLPGVEVSRLYSVESSAAEGNPATACVWFAEGCRLRFLPPRGWSVKRQSTNTAILLTQPDLKAAISLVLHREPASADAPPDVSIWRERVRERHPSGTLVGESVSTVDGRDGWGFDFVTRVEKGIPTLIRVVVVPYPGGVAECEMRTSATHERLGRRAIRTVLSSLTIERLPPQPSPPR